MAHQWQREIPRLSRGEHGLECAGRGNTQRHHEIEKSMKLRAGVLALVFVLGACAEQDSAPQSAAAAGAALTALPSAIATPPRSRDTPQAIANAPNRGALVNYDRRTAPVRSGAFTSHKVAISEEHALRAVVSGKMNLPLPDGSNMSLDYERHAEGTDGNWTWVGRVEGGDPLQEAIITFGDKAVFGSIPQGRGLPDLDLTTRNGALWVVQTNPALAPSVDRSGTDTMVRTSTAAIGRGTGIAAVATAASSARVVPMAALEASAAAGPANTVDVVLGYTNGLAIKFGGQSQAVTRMSHLVEIANQGYANSAVNGALRLVGTVQVNYTDSGTSKAALVALTGNTGAGPATIPSTLAPLRTARETYGADVVALVRAYEFANEGCGIAWLLGANQTPISPAADAPFGYAIVADLPDGASAPGPDGKNYFCAKEGLAHELGHLMGSAHDRDNVGTNTDGSLQLGRYAYSIGQKTTAATGNFYTIMSYGDDGQQDYRVFSNPNITSCGGRACGVADQTDNARSLNQTIPVVATFRNMLVPLLGAARGDITGDGKTDILWRFQSQSLFSYWQMNGPTRVASGVNGVTWSSRIVGVGDFDGDGLSDVLWVNNDNFVWIWRSKGGGNFDYLPVDFFPAGWSVAAVGDLDGDRKADIVWRNQSQSLISYWLMNGATRLTAGTTGVASNNKIIGAGDFDGDSRADLLWSDINETILWMFRSRGDGGFDFMSMGAYPPGWKLGGVTDLNADGKADLVWRNEQAGLFSFWWMNGASRTASGNVGIASGNRIVGTGDFDGDGRGDVLWTNDANRFAWMFRSRGDGNFDYQFVDYLPPDWVISNGGY